MSNLIDMEIIIRNKRKKVCVCVYEIYEYENYEGDQ